MKNFLLILLLSICTFAANAQESQTYDSKLGYSESFLLYPGATTDVIKVGDSTWSYTVWKESYGPLKYDAKVYLDSTGGTRNNVVVKLQAKKFLDDAAWTDLKTATWKLGQDTSILFTESSTAQQYRYYRLYVLGADDTFLAKITLFDIKFWE